jgi:hypothetical protein
VCDAGAIHGEKPKAFLDQVVDRFWKRLLFASGNIAQAATDG